MEIFLASGNQHKKHEFEQLFSEHKIIIPKELNIEFDPDETGTTFNAYKSMKTAQKNSA